MPWKGFRDAAAKLFATLALEKNAGEIPWQSLRDEAMAHVPLGYCSAVDNTVRREEASADSEEEEELHC